MFVWIISGISVYKALACSWVFLISFISLTSVLVMFFIMLKLATDNGYVPSYGDTRVTWHSAYFMDKLRAGFNIEVLICLVCVLFSSFW